MRRLAVIALVLMTATNAAAQFPELERFKSGKSTYRFTAHDPIPDEVVTKLVKARLEENASRTS